MTFNILRRLYISCNLVFDTAGRPKKKRLSTPLPAVSSDTTPVTPTTTVPMSAPPTSPPIPTTKTDTDNHHTTPPSNEDIDITTTATIKDNPKHTTTDNNSDNSSVNVDKDQVTDHIDATTKVESLTTTQAVVENVKKEIFEEKVLPPSPKSVELVVPVQSPKHSPKQNIPSPVEPSSPCPEVTPSPAAIETTPNKEEVQEPHEDTMTTSQGSVKKKKLTPDGKKKSKASLQERRREQASDWIVDFCK